MVWSGNFAYAVGLITTDGCLSKDGRHIDLTSKDTEQIENFKKALKLKNKIAFKFANKEKKTKYYRIQFGNVKLYKYLLSIGLLPRKSKTQKKIKVPDKYFCDFLRGCLDGDGYTTSGYSTQWPKSFVFYTGFTSASIDYLMWLNKKIMDLYNINGYIKKVGRSAFSLTYAKYNSLKLIKIMYHPGQIIYLKRKKFKIDAALGIIQVQAGVL